MGHAVDVGEHDPVGGVDEHFHEPAVDIVGVDFGHEHGAADDHEAGDVVAPGAVLEAADGVVEGEEAGGAVVPVVGEAALVVEGVLAVGGEPGFVAGEAVDELSPADDLADEAFAAGEGGIGVVLEEAVDDFLGRQESAVEEGGEEGVVEDFVMAGDGVFVGAEVGEAVLEEGVEFGEGVGAGDGPVEGVEVAEVVGEVGLDEAEDFLGEGVGGEAGDVGRGFAFGEGFSVVGVVAPLPAFWFEVFIDHDVEALALAGVEVGHEEAFGLLAVGLPFGAGGEEGGGGLGLELDLILGEVVFEFGGEGLVVDFVGVDGLDLVGLAEVGEGLGVGAGVLVGGLEGLVVDFLFLGDQGVAVVAHGAEEEGDFLFVDFGLCAEGPVFAHEDWGVGGSGGVGEELVAEDEGEGFWGHGMIGST